jgi:L-asparaginase/Glu-tRNA(Gln) amidotransferase subunit D
MKVLITWRIDTEEIFTLDSSHLEYKNWEDVFADIRQIETRNTVLSVQRTDVVTFYGDNY